MVNKNALHRAALDQAKLLLDYLECTESEALSMPFIDEHAQALAEFARQAKTSAGPAERGSREPGRKR